MNKVDLAFNKLLREYGKSNKKVWTIGKDGKNKARIGAWILDSAYGGYKVAQIVNKGGGERDLFDQRRRNPAEFVRWVNTVISARRQK